MRFTVMVAGRRFGAAPTMKIAIKLARIAMQLGARRDEIEIV